MTAAWSRPLISLAELAARLDRPELRLIECGVYHVLPDRSDFRVESTEPLYAGAAGDRPIVTYCGAGIAASSDAFVLTLLRARDVAVWDGSLEEWARDPSCPTESGPVAS